MNILIEKKIATLLKIVSNNLDASLSAAIWFDKLLPLIERNPFSIPICAKSPEDLLRSVLTINKIKDELDENTKKMLRLFLKKSSYFFIMTLFSDMVKGGEKYQKVAYILFSFYEGKHREKIAEVLNQGIIEQIYIQNDPKTVVKLTHDFPEDLLACAILNVLRGNFDKNKSKKEIFEHILAILANYDDFKLIKVIFIIFKRDKILARYLIESLKILLYLNLSSKKEMALFFMKDFIDKDLKEIEN